MGSPEFIVSQSDVQVAEGSPYLWLTSEMRADLLETVPLSYVVGINLGG